MVDHPNLPDTSLPNIPADKFKRTLEGDVPIEPSLRSDAKHGRCCHSKGGFGRNLIVCIDGTSNQFGKKNTNVIELYNLILNDDDDNQQTWYNSGIGTYARPSWKSLKFYRQVLSHKIDLAITWDFERTVLAAYRWLSENYKSGDSIFLFGFSRGAFQVRMLSAMIEKVGLIYKGNEMQIPFAYELYADPHSDEPVSSVTRVGSDSPPRPQGNSLIERFTCLFSRKDAEAETRKGTTMAQRFKSAFSRKDVKVHFVGAWDTVSSIGFARGKRMLPGTIDGMIHVCYFRHALALDERRVKFLPEYAYGGATNPVLKTESRKKNTNLLTANEDASTVDGVRPGIQSAIENVPVGPSLTGNKLAGNLPHTLEVWFAGTHSDIGGGNAENMGMDRSRPPLRWMVFEAGALGLRTTPFDRELSTTKEQVEIKESLTWPWWFLEVLPFKRLTYSKLEDGKLTTRSPHLGSSRIIHPGQKIHNSLILTDRTGKTYTPKARSWDNNPWFWINARSKGLGEWGAIDLYEYTLTLVKMFAAGHDNSVLAALRQTAISVDGRQAVYEGVIESLRESNLQLGAKYQRLQGAGDILQKLALQGIKLIPATEFRLLVLDLWQSGEKCYQEMSQQFREQFTDHCLYDLRGHGNVIRSVAFSPDGKRVVSGSYDETVRIWDAETGKQVGEPIRGHTESVMSVAFSPDGKSIVSGSSDMRVRICHSETGKQIGEPIRGHTDEIKSVAFSPDGKRIASGSDDETVRIWDAETGKQVGDSCRGHTDWVMSVAFSPDGKCIVSGSKDQTIRIWDAETGKQVGDLYRGHTGRISSVAFSPDGKRVVSGSYDKTIQIWNAETGKQIGEPFRRHTDDINSVAFSPDGKNIVSGSDDETVRLWDAKTGKQIGEPFCGHTSYVMAVAFSPDGQRVVSGALDYTLRIWDAETERTAESLQSVDQA